MNKTDLSIITPVYQGASFLDEFYRRMAGAAGAITPDYELIFVNDGSTDQSLEKLLELHAADPRVVIIDLAKNSGHHNALRTGLAHARGELVFTIDDDLEESPEWLEQFCSTMAREKSDIVFGAQSQRKGRWLERVAGNIFFFFVQKILRQDVIRNIITARLMTRRFVNALLSFKERNIPYCRLCFQAGFASSVLYLNKKSNRAGTYSLRRKLAFARDYITSYSIQPLHWILLAGFSILLLSGFWFIMLFAGGVEKSLPFILAFMTLNTGLVLSAMGIQSVYLGKVVEELKHAPASVIRHIYDHTGRGN